MQQVELEKWIPFAQAWRDFTDAKPGLGLSASRFAVGRFLSVHGEALQKAGAIVRGPHGRTHAHTDHVIDALWRVIHGLPLPDYSAVKELSTTE